MAQNGFEVMFEKLNVDKNLGCSCSSDGNNLYIYMLAQRSNYEKYKRKQAKANHHKEKP
jgi:hypothetical protein